MQLLEVVTGHSQFLSHFSIPQAMPTQPVRHRRGSAAEFSHPRRVWSVLEFPTKTELSAQTARILANSRTICIGIPYSPERWFKRRNYLKKHIYAPAYVPGLACIGIPY